MPGENVDARPPRSDEESRVRTEHVVENEAVEESVVIPGDPEQIARETAAVSPEGRPGDPKTAPRGIRLEILVGLIVVLAFAVGLGVWVNPIAGVLAGVFGCLAIMLNPVVGAASQRAQEREVVMRHHAHDAPGTAVIRTTSKRKERRMSRTVE